MNDLRVVNGNAEVTLKWKVGNRKAVLTWDLPDHATGVAIWMKGPGDSAHTKLPYPVFDDTFTFGGLVNGATYEFKVQSYNDLIPGRTSGSVAVKPTGPPVAGPDG
ncbi:fibronectin type III domain-containing protein [Actinomadura fulvescens]|uniref:fibronectin type III domain-containing protein n=1 Tax=Actinomadura fulvescens TaxID=46160 RepID=UPI0031D2040B